jgi:hypothetical protein
MNMDEIAPSLGADDSKDQELILSVERDQDLADIDGPEAVKTDEGKSAEGSDTDTSEEPHLYGIDVSNSAILKDAGVIADDMIATIFLGTEQQEKAEAFLKLLLN